MQILFTYTKLPVYKRLDGIPEEFDAPTPTIERYDQDGELKRVTWQQTGQFVECSNCIVFQWRGTFDHEREAQNLRYEKTRKELLALESATKKCDCPEGISCVRCI